MVTSKAKGNTVFRIVRRRETAATRKRRALISKERQGLDGKWESNKKKAAFRMVKRKTAALGTMFKVAQARQKMVASKSLDSALELKEELASAADANNVKVVVEKLEQLPVNAALLKRTMLPRVLADVATQFPSASGAIQRLRLQWRNAFREEVTKRKEIATSPSVAVTISKKVEASNSNGRKHTEKLLATKTRQSKLERHIIQVVDDGTAREMASKDRRVTVRKNSTSTRSSSGSSSGSTSSGDSSSEDSAIEASPRAARDNAEASLCSTPTLTSQQKHGLSSRPGRAKQQSLSMFFKKPCP